MAVHASTIRFSVLCRHTPRRGSMGWEQNSSPATQIGSARLGSARLGSANAVVARNRTVHRARAVLANGHDPSYAAPAPAPAYLHLPAAYFRGWPRRNNKHAFTKRQLRSSSSSSSSSSLPDCRLQVMRRLNFHSLRLFVPYDERTWAFAMK